MSTTTNETPTCTTCGNDYRRPYRRYDERGKVLEGCVDESHTEHLNGMISESARWHGRKEAKAIRARMKRGQAGKGY